jgi:hypothetical protein
VPTFHDFTLDTLRTGIMAGAPCPIEIMKRCINDMHMHQVAIKDIVIRGGENIYQREIEEFLYTHPDIEDVQVIGVPDEKYGEELCAWIRTRAGAEPLDAEVVRTYATGKLAHYKIPRYVRIADSFPTTVTGKVRKVEMRAQSIELLGLRDAGEATQPGPQRTVETSS